MRGSSPPRRTRTTDGTYHDAAPLPPRPTPSTGGLCGPRRRRDVVRRGTRKPTRELCARGYWQASLVENRARYVRYRGHSRQFVAGPAEAAHAAREERGASLRGRDSPRSMGSDAPFAPPAYRRRRGDFRFPTQARTPFHAGGGWDDSAGRFAVNAGPAGRQSPDAGGQTRPLAAGWKRSRRPGQTEKRWMMVAVAQRSERRIVVPETRGSTPPGHPSGVAGTEWNARSSAWRSTEQTLPPLLVRHARAAGGRLTGLGGRGFKSRRAFQLCATSAPAVQADGQMDVWMDRRWPLVAQR
jgi:hypothetical protein